MAEAKMEEGWAMPLDSLSAKMIPMVEEVVTTDLIQVCLRFLYLCPLYL
jgi:hypothetical protein